MSVLCKTQGFVFKRQDIRESDRTYSVFTSDSGRLELNAKAIRKIASKVRGGIEIFSFCDLEFVQGKTCKTLTGSTFLQKYPDILNNPHKLEVAYKISGLLDEFLKGQEKDDKIMNLLGEVFESLENWEGEILYHYFFWRLMVILGYGPEISKCAKCQNKLNPYKLYFSCKDGGVVCCGNDCKKINSDVVKIIRLFLQKSAKILVRLKVQNSSLDLLSEISENWRIWKLA